MAAITKKLISVIVINDIVHTPFGKNRNGNRVELTPLLSFAVRELGRSAGVNITASHNPAEYNGYKVYGADGGQIMLGVARAIQAEIDLVDPFDDVVTMSFGEASEKGLINKVPEKVIDAYIEKMLEASTGEDCPKLRVAYTPLHGVGLECVSRVLHSIGIPKLDAVVQSGMADLVLFGVKPTYPSEKYGYIVSALDKGDPYPVECFIEKPDEKSATQLIEQGALWNCGVFAFTLDYLKNVTQKYVDTVDFQDVRARYCELPKNSFDYEVVEKAFSVAVISYEGSWKDLGTWNTLCEEMADDASGRVVGAETCENTHVINELGLPLVALGSFRYMELFRCLSTF